jgi:hypothetical protein
VGTGAADRVRIECRISAVAVLFPVGDQRVAVGVQGGFEGRRFGMRQGDPPQIALLGAGFGDRRRRVEPGTGVGARFQRDRGAQLPDGGDLG